VRLVTRNGGTPGLGALLIRNIFRLVDSLPFFYVVGLASCFITEQRVRIGDLAAGTLLVVDSDAAAKTLAQLGSMVAHSGLAPALVELIHDLLERWQSLDTVKRDELARAILARADSASPAAQLAALNDAQFHLIGPLQSNKTARAAETFGLPRADGFQLRQAARPIKRPRSGARLAAHSRHHRHVAGPRGQRDGQSHALLG